jgi:TonB family protein
MLSFFTYFGKAWGKRQLAVRLLPVFLLAGPLAAHAQAPTASPDATYAGPRFAGGPDSLRAYLSQHRLRQVSEPVFVQFDIGPDHPPENIQLLTPPGHKPWPATAVAEATRLVRAMPAWASGRQDVEVPITTVTLGLNPARPTPTALPYADEMPVFANMEPGIIGVYGYLPTVLVVPADVLRKKLQGDVYAYFEVSETGHLEHIKILGGATPALNEAAQQTIAKFPQQALRPAQLRGQPVRIYYVLSIGYHVE